ncbi:LysR family transcriptional regulator [Martelella alba]|uniref:LysR family transcriptional regulator n=1 Tax=Martelella alba TaxID=2590451 RepID=A0ABY2SET5_9HYPH|nr:LysR family transcriptional regulator [Martelella alba]TKI03346.1 LysR family transcriptional regulator [Martelella alba]
MKKRILTERDLKALRIFCAVAQAGGFSAAENKLNITKATISRQIKSVEETLGAKLCSRGPQGFELTAAGKTALLYAQDALDALDRIFPAIDANREIISGPLAIGISDNSLSHPDCAIHRALRELHILAPLINLKLYTLTAPQLIQALHDRKVDIVIKGIMEDQKLISFRYDELYTEVHRLYYFGPAPKDKPPLVYRQQQFFVEESISKLGFARGPEATGVEAVATLIATGKFVGILPSHYANLLKSVLPLHVMPDTPSWEIKHFAVTHAARPLTPAADAMLGLLMAAHRRAAARPAFRP